MTKRNLSPGAPPAVLEWNRTQERLHSEATAWAKATIDELVLADERYTARTVAEVMSVLDNHQEQPSGWARINRGDTSSYKERYAIVRNYLESMAKSKRVVCGTTINKLGVDGSTTYARPRDVSSEWNIEVTGDSSGTLKREVGEFLSGRGMAWVQSAATSVLLRRKTMGDVSGKTTTTTDSDGRTPRKRRKTNAT